MATHRFDPYNLNVSLFAGHLAAYALGRQLRRFQWHHEQWIVLALEASLKHEHIDRVCPSSGQQMASPQVYSEGLETVAKIEAGVEKEAGQQKDFAEESYNQLASIVRQLSTPAIDAMLSVLDQRRPVLFTVTEPAILDARELSSAIFEAREEPESCEIRMAGLRSLLKPFGRQVDFLRKSARKIMDEKSDAYFSLGDCIETMICPRQMYRHMTLSFPRFVCSRSLPRPDDYFEGVASTHRFYLGYHSFAPGSLKLTWSAAAECRDAMGALQLWNNSIAELFIVKRQAKPKPLSSPENDCGVEEPEEENGSTAKDSGSFECRLKSSPSHERLIEELHTRIVGQKTGHRVSFPSIEKLSSVEGAYGERFNYTENGGDLILEGREVRIKGEKNVRVVRTLVAGRGSVCSANALTDSGMDNLYKAIDRLNEKFAKVGLKITNERSKGYRIALLQATPTDDLH